MAVLKTVVVGVVILVVLCSGIGMLLPRHSHVERSIVIDAPRGTVFALIDGFKQFNKWSPWAALDPNAKYTFEGPAFGVGAKLSWAGDPNSVGSGSQEIIAIQPGEAVTTRLSFVDQAPATVRFELHPEPGGTKVTWSLETDNGAGPIGRWFGLMIERWVGPDYERGLVNLKALAEGLPKADFADLDVAVVEATPVTVASLASQSSKDAAEIGAAIGAAYTEIVAFMKAHALEQSGPPVTINLRWDDAGYAFDAAIPVDSTRLREVPEGSRVQVKQTDGGKALKIVTKGPYGGMPPSYAELEAYMAARGYEASGPSWNEYVTDPKTTPEADLTTNFYQPVK